MNMRTIIKATEVLVLAALCGCGSNPKSGYGLRLADGDVEKGRQAFIALRCAECHKVDGVDQLPQPSKFNLTIGGETVRVKTYGELVTSIINPSHVVQQKYKTQLADAQMSVMPKFNHEMTVEQMIDLVAFLQSRYKLLMPEYPLYPPYPN